MRAISRASANPQAPHSISSVPQDCTTAWIKWRPCAARCLSLRPLDGLNAVMLQRAAEESTIAAFVLRAGRIADPFLLQFAELASQPRSAEQILRDVLEPSGPDPAKSNAADSESARNECERLVRGTGRLPVIAGALVLRSPSRGRDLFCRGQVHLALPAILRACSRVLARQPERQR